ncbi:NAD(P)/FAD-dependent oxidoreductase [Frankia sp. AgPm24]|uniref:flavin-containing monooxygenase n=1 Tax=Frankia sp. AgPm24 TaxID=631128 RepID=UPI00200C2BC5|nr:NAD(P)/FAD-dependent oxidoreductase [Frankia sp. AgPm24]MCK9923728.1 NAD(P)/FAD-dependent oxidoreductase [Frankia sp. AgPm24]
MAHGHLHVEPVTDGDDEIAAALEDVSVPALTAVLVGLTGDPAPVRGPIRPRQWVHNEFQGALTEDEKALLRRDALAVIRSWRDAGCPPAKELDPALVHEIMNWIACEPVPDDYVAMYRDEMDLEGRNPRAIRLPDPERVPLDPGFGVLVIGCGESGLLAGIRLKEAGIPFTILEKNADVGGTWYENRYPGARVDVASHYYNYSFGPNDSFSEYYARQPELYRYFRARFDEHGIGEHVRWRCEVERAVWDDDGARWQVTYRTADGTTHTASASALISGVGLLSRPLIPDIPGLADFAGPAFHSAQWDERVDLGGRRVALIGAGASGFQLGPAVVDEVERLTVFQRTPQWMAPNPRYHDQIRPGERWAMRHLPGYGRWYRFMLMWQSSDRLLELVRVDPEWPDFPRTANAFSATRREAFVRWIDEQVGDDPDLARKVTPDYPPMAKRMLQDNGSWLRCLRRPHVDLVNDRILRVEPDAVVTTAGRHEVDVIVMATGFRASEVLWPMEIVGRGGVSLTDVWQGRPAGYLNITVPDFPNLFILGGPATSLAHAGSVIFLTECQMRYVGDALALLAGGRRSIEPTPTAYARYAEDLQAEIGTLMWGHPSIEHSWYKAADGRVYVLCPWRLVDYWAMTARLKPEDHAVS